MREIDYSKLLDNYKEMINVLEYDSMRSAGKAKINGPVLDSLHNLHDRYELKLNSTKAPKKKEVN